jgi:hypothetical protein
MGILPREDVAGQQICAHLSLREAQSGRLITQKLPVRRHPQDRRCVLGPLLLSYLLLPEGTTRFSCSNQFVTIERCRTTPVFAGRTMAITSRPSGVTSDVALLAILNLFPSRQAIPLVNV